MISSRRFTSCTSPLVTRIDADKCGDVAVQVQQGVHLDSGLAPAKLRPRKQRQAQVDGGRIQSISAPDRRQSDRGHAATGRWKGKGEIPLRRIEGTKI